MNMRTDITTKPSSTAQSNIAPIHQHISRKIHLLLITVDDRPSHAYGISVVGGTCTVRVQAGWQATLGDVGALALIELDHVAGVEGQCVCENEEEDGCREVDELHGGEKGAGGLNGKV
jgi:hypothetical protein